MKLIRLTGNRPGIDVNEIVVLNAENIDAITVCDNKTFVYVNGNSFAVKESLEEVENLVFFGGIY